MELVEAVHHDLADVGELLDELGLEVAVHTQQILGHEDLAVHIGTGADAQDGHMDLFLHGLGHDRGDALHDHGENAGLLQSLGVLDELAGRLGGAALDLEAAEGGSGLGSHADVAHDVDAGVDHAADGGSHVDAALQLDAVAQGLLGEAVGGLDGLLGAHVVGAEGHVADDEGVGSALDHGLDVVDHVIHGHGDGGVIAQHDHAQGVAHQDDLDIALVHDGGGGVVIGSAEGKLAALILELLEVQDRHFLLRHFKAPLSKILGSGPNWVYQRIAVCGHTTFR